MLPFKNEQDQQPDDLFDDDGENDATPEIIAPHLTRLIRRCSRFEALQHFRCCGLRNTRPGPIGIVPMMTKHPGFCAECRAPIDPEDESRECWKCDSDEYSWAWDDDWTYFYWETWIAQKRNPPRENHVAGFRRRPAQSIEVQFFKEGQVSEFRPSPPFCLSR